MSTPVCNRAIPPVQILDERVIHVNDSVSIEKVHGRLKLSGKNTFSSPCNKTVGHDFHAQPIHPKYRLAACGAKRAGQLLCRVVERGGLPPAMRD
jgi:hypothetical protein